MTYRCPVCNNKHFTFHTDLINRYENKIVDQSRSIYSISITCAKCGEELMQDEFSFINKFGERPGVDEVYNRAEQIFNDWLAENSEQDARELNAFNNCPHCRTSMYVSLEKHVHFYENGTSDPIYRVVCHGCDREAAMGLTAQSAIDKWNRTFTMEE